MQDDRKRVQIDAPYAHALGLAAYCFAQCEWNAVYSAERLQPGYVGTVEPQRKTAGVIANDLIKLVNAITDQTLQAICLPPANEFKRLVQERNGLLHGKPITAKNGDQQLAKGNQEWTIAEIDAFSDDVMACSILLNDMVHKHLVTP